MPMFVTDSRYRGFLGPKDPPEPTPLADKDWIHLLHDLVAGVTGLPFTMVRNDWQRIPPNRPSIDEDWCGIGITGTDADWQPVIMHVSTGDGYDAFQRQEVCTLLCVFIGPNNNKYASYLRDGLFIEQNLAELRRVAATVVEVQGFTRSAEYVLSQWWDRTDVNVIIRREIRRNYPVLNLLSARVGLQIDDHPKPKPLPTQNLAPPEINDPDSIL